MFGTVARMRVKPGAEPLLMAWTEAMRGRDNAVRASHGWLSTAIFRSLEDPLVFWMAVVFESREAYRENAERPNQDAQYIRLRSCLEADPEWHDGDVFFFGTPDRGIRVETLPPAQG